MKKLTFAVVRGEEVWMFAGQKQRKAERVLYGMGHAVQQASAMCVHVILKYSSSNPFKTIY